MPDLLAVATLAVALVAAVFAILAYATARSRLGAVLSRTDAAELHRREGDAIRSAGEQQTRGLRQELGTILTQHQANALASVSAVSGEIVKQVHMFGERLEVSNRTVEERIQGIAAKLNDDLGQMGQEAGRNREALRAVIEKKLSDAAELQAAAGHALRDELQASFGRLGQRVSETLGLASEQQKERLDNTQRALDALKEHQGQAGERLRQLVEGRLDALRQENTEKLEEMRRTVDEKLQTTLETRLGESFTRVVEQLTLVSQGIGEMRALASNVGDLKTVLTNPKVRGTFGEVQLALLIEDFLTPDQYLRNAQIKEGSGERVEYAIRVRTSAEGDEILLPVDAKFPREDYDRLVAAMHDGETLLAVKFRKDLENRIKLFARNIKEKYVDPPSTTEFGILFLPTEGLYAEALREPALFDYLRRECCVVLAGPTTFSAILSAFQMNFRSLALARQSTEVWRVLSAVRTEFGRYNDVVNRLGNQLRTAAGSVEKLGVRTRAMDRRLRSVELLPNDGSAQRVLGLTPDLLAGEEEEEDVAALKAELDVVVPLRAREEGD